MFVQILSCDATLGSCCSNNMLVVLLDIARKIFHVVQIIVPILLILGSVIHLMKMINDPEMKNGTKRFINMYIAAVIIFFLPVVIDVVLGILPTEFRLSACWDKAKNRRETIHYSSSYTPSTKKSQSSIFVKASEYQKGVKQFVSDVNSYYGGGTSSGSYTNTGAGNGSATGKSIVLYAKSFVGKSYLYGGSWNGELPYTPTDCSGFVQGVFKHFGIKLTRSTFSQWRDKGSYSLIGSNDEIKAGDLVMYNGHVAILTGNGTEIVHAKGRKWGIVVDSDYRSSSKAILGIMRINGVN